MSQMSKRQQKLNKRRKKRKKEKQRRKRRQQQAKAKPQQIGLGVPINAMSFLAAGILSQRVESISDLES